MTAPAEPYERVRATLASDERLVTFIQYDEPALKAGEYTVTATQQTNQPAPHDQFTATRRFAVAGQRFQIDPADLSSVFPPDLGVGELSGDLPHILVNRRTLPWERSSVSTDASAPWLAILLFDAASAPKPVKRTARDLVPKTQTITVAGSKVTSTGTMDDGIASYPGLENLDYGEAPDDQCMAIDVDVTTFSAIAPTALDLPYLAHIRETDTVDSQDAVTASESIAVVLGNRVPTDGTTAVAFLVSLENMGPLLPDDAGTPSPGLSGQKTVRLLTYRWWSFTPSIEAVSFQALLEGVNAVPEGQVGVLSSLQVPFLGDRPTGAQVQQAMNDQAAGTLQAGDAAVLAHNAFALGYVPLTHRLRHAGRTVSWFRGPLAPLAVTATVKTPISTPDAATRYDPQTGMFDVSYSAAWQLGRLLGLQSKSYSVALYDWRRSVRTGQLAAAEQQLLEEQLGGRLPSVVGARAERLAATDDDPPAPVVDFLAKLALLNGVPFNYLVPDARMLPPESLRMFHLDHAWIDALLDGAFSIGRATSGQLERDAALGAALREHALAARRRLRQNPAPVAAAPPGTEGEVTGFLLRSAAVAGWPNAAATAWADANRTDQLPLLRMQRLGADVLLCLFEGVADVVAVHEPPGQLHCGVEGKAGAWTTTLREVKGTAPGHQYDPPKGEAPIPTRADGRTVQTQLAASSIEGVLNDVFGQGLTEFTSAEYALEMVKGVVEVEFRQGG